jgi:hypothetical protein
MGKNWDDLWRGLFLVSNEEVVVMKRTDIQEIDCLLA